MIKLIIIKTAARDTILYLAQDKMSPSVIIGLSLQIYAKYKYPAMVYGLQYVNNNGK
jgi:hypothetical protein